MDYVKLPFMMLPISKKSTQNVDIAEETLKNKLAIRASKL